MDDSNVINDGEESKLKEGTDRADIHGCECASLDVDKGHGEDGCNIVDGSKDSVD